MRKACLCNCDGHYLQVKPRKIHIVSEYSLMIARFQATVLYCDSFCDPALLLTKCRP